MGQDEASTFHDVEAVKSAVDEIRRSAGVVVDAAETIAAVSLAAGFAGREYGNCGDMIGRGFDIAAEVGRSWARATVSLTDAVQSAVTSADAVDHVVATSLSSVSDPVMPR